MMISRRRMLLGGAILTPLAAARADTTDLAVLCDLTLGFAMHEAARAFRAAAGVHLDIFPTAPGLIVPLLMRDVQIDIVAGQTVLLEQAAQSELISAGLPGATWNNPLVIAEMADAAGTPATGKFAVSDLPAASGIPDGAAIAARMGIDPVRIVSAIDTTEVVFLLLSGAARTGLLFATDVRSDPRLRVVSPIPGQPPASYAAAVTKGASRPDPGAFISFLRTPPAARILSAAGLEAAS